MACCLLGTIIWIKDVLLLTHWGRDTMDTISQMTFTNAFSWMKMFEFRFKFHRSLFLRVQLTIFQHWFRKWIGIDQATSHYLKQWCLDYWRIYASLGLSDVIRPLGTNFNAVLIEIQIFSFRKLHLIISYAKWQPFCLSLNMLRLKQGPHH